MHPADFVGQLKQSTSDWTIENISIGFPSPIRNGRIVKEPKHLGHGWIGFDFGQALGRPTRVINDAAMQALGSYHGGRMLFLGLGTGLGSALALENKVFPLELGDLPYRQREKIENFLGIPGIDRLGEADWKEEVIFAVTQLKLAFIADYVVLGGGLIHRFGNELPKGIERGKNENAFLGGLRLWEVDAGQPRWEIF
jgi:predicted NBD/HSP70 family sugar kinase